MDQISIIIVHYNTKEDTLACLDSLLKIKYDTSLIDLKIIIVDNGSKEIFDLPANKKKDFIEVIRSDANLGFTGGNNLGISHAVKNYNSDYFILLNSDTEVDKNFITPLLSAFNKNKNLGVASSKIYFYSGNEYHHYPEKYHGQVLWYAGGSMDWKLVHGFHRGVDEVDRGHFDDQQYSDFASGCCMMIKREVIEHVGILDKKYFLYYEDNDYCLRCKKKGFEIGFVPTSIVWHKNSGSSEGVGSKTHIYYQTRNKYLIGFKHGNIMVKLRMLKELIKGLFEENKFIRKASLDTLLGRWGKQKIFA